MSARDRRTVCNQCKYRKVDNDIAVWRMNEQEPWAPLFGPREKLSRIIRAGQVPHELVIVVGRRERNRHERDDQ